MKLLKIVLLGLILIPFYTFAQVVEDNFVQGEALIQLTLEGNVKNIIQDLQTFEGDATQLTLKKKISDRLRIWLVSFDDQIIDQDRFVDALYMHKDVEEAQNNHKVTMRSITPNDPQFAQQWQYLNTGQSGGTPGADLDADDAWSITTGGVTPLGDTIVVAVLDDGIDLSHSDFGDNLWVNHAEIPNNNIDDDGNGYVDDYRGWSIVTNSDNIAGGGHGTPVAGIIGAKGDNNNGVTGVNWNVKIMIVKNNFNSNEAAVLEAYSYPLEARVLYNESGGTQGAFVVSTNASWGVNQGQPANAPLWCQFYDTLGYYGILNAGATANANFNIDQVGDLPTACPSDYMIAVTNMNHNDLKETQAGYGLTTIDLGAFGEGTITPQLGGGYGGFGGTSGATPHVAGTIGLLYSAPCPGFISLAKAHPDSAARLVKKFILDGADQNTSLQNITVTGGRLNMNGALQELLNSCPAADDCFPPFSLNVSNLLDTSATLNWGAIIDTATTFNIRYRLASDTAWTYSSLTDSILTYNLSGLMPCSNYVFEVQMDCDTSLSDFSTPISFKTDGCCTAPDGITTLMVTDSTATVGWNNLLAALSYNVRIRPAGTTTWANYTGVITASFDFLNLQACSPYEVEVETVCMGQSTGFGTTFMFNTTCGACSTLPYCTSNGNSVDDEWIGKVIIGTINNSSGADPSGYADFTNISTNLVQGQIYPFTLEQTYSGQTFPEYFRIWIDYTQDGDFNDAGELVFDAGSTTTAPQTTGNITIPATAILGSTRMRVSMRWNSSPNNCGSFDFGEVEDYCVTITDSSAATACNIPANLAVTAINQNDVTLTWDADSTSNFYTVRYRVLGTSNWSTDTTSFDFMVLQGLVSCDDYEVELEANCGNSLSLITTTSFFTACNCFIPTNIDTTMVNELNATVIWDVVPHATEYEVRFRALSGGTWIVNTTTNTSFFYDNLTGGTLYEVICEAMCPDNSTSGLSPSFVFSTAWTVGTTPQEIGLEQFQLYPNPFKDHITLDFNLLETKNMTIQLYNLAGQLVQNDTQITLQAGTNQLKIPTPSLINGLYFIKITTDNGTIVRKVIK